MMNKTIINALKLLDKMVGPLLLRLPILRYKSSNSLKSILIIRPGGIGDAALLLPLIKGLKKNLLDAKIDILCEPRNMGVFTGAYYIDKILSYWSLKDVTRLMQKGYDLIIDTEQSHLLSTFFATSIIKASKRVGFSSNKNRKHYDINLPYYHEEYEVHSFNRLFSHAIPGWREELIGEPPYIYVSDNQRKKVEEIISSIKRPIACIFAGASIPLRRWFPKRWAKVSEGLWDMGFYPVLLGSRQEERINERICYYSKSPVINLTGMLNLAEIAELFRRSRLLVSTDSGILHIGVIEGISTVSLFGPGIADKWGPKGNGHIVIRKDLSCSPCTRFGHTPFCQKNALCMRLIGIDDVMSAIENIIN
ncbi:MAG: hypothetical protein DRG39_03395 [Deltaproteobacteria bacterium]|nr:MAG: hypothetical protein DRG39_03395 [Deltaproteobacteria bacterium]